MTHKPHLVLLPGLMCNDVSWQPVLDQLHAHATCQLIDHGNANTLVQMAEHVSKVAPPQFCMAGHSMGGRVALQVCRLVPHRIQKLALMGTGYHALPAGQEGIDEKNKRQSFLDLAQTKGVRRLAIAWVQGMVSPEHLKDAALIERIVQMFEIKSADIYGYQVNALLTRPDATDVLKNLNMPTCVVTGEFDSWATPEQHQEICDLIPSKPQLNVIKDSGHMMMMENPQGTLDVLVKWLRG
ncbi:MAG: alpha/beta hydrolase [Betaproteobacteria bacterium]|nr:alpha/beta hydrolase [Betaproteobacteria bacterium]